MLDNAVLLVVRDALINSCAYVRRYYVLNALESGETTQERAFAIFAELIRDVILGLVAGLITTISMNFAANDNETNLRLKRLRNWMSEKKLPQNFRRRAMEHFTETWTNKNHVNLRGLMTECPPAMAGNMAQLLYGRFISAVPLFKGLSTEVVSALCLRCKPMQAMRGQNIIQEGEPGKEMYMLITGEVEVSERRRGRMQETETVRLGFLSEGAFFGEAPVLGWRGEPGLELRMRTVRAVTDVELCYITRDDVHELSDQYTELRSRMNRFGNSGRTITKKTLRKIDLTEEELKELSSGFKAKVETAAEVRDKEHLEKGTFVPAPLLPNGTATVVRAAQRFKKQGAAARAKATDDREDEVERLAKQMDEQGGIGRVLLAAEATREEVALLKTQLADMQASQKSMLELMHEQRLEQRGRSGSPG